MLRIVRTDSKNPDFVKLVAQLDEYLAEKDGKDHAFYDQYNQLDSIRHVVVAYDGIEPCGCGAIKEFSPLTMEVKRMYTTPSSRGKNVATTVLKELELWTREMAYQKCILETGKRQAEAIALYRKNGYQIMENYGQYKGVEYSLCFEKDISM